MLFPALPPSLATWQGSSHIVSLQYNIPSFHYFTTLPISHLYLPVSILLLFISSFVYLSTSHCTKYLPTACTTEVELSIAFGGKLWPINPTDMNLGTIPSGQCLGGVFDLTQGSDVGSGGGNPSWVVGDTFLVRLSLRDIVSSRNVC